MTEWQRQSIPSGYHVLEVHGPTMLLSMVAMLAFVAVLLAGCKCAEHLRDWCLQQHQQQEDNVPLATNGPPPYNNLSDAEGYEQTCEIYEIHENNTPRTKQTKTKGTNTRTTKCHKTTNTEKCVSALIEAGNRWAADNKIEG